MNTDTCPDCSNHPCDCGMPAGYTPTPRTNTEHDQFPMGGFTLDFVRQLESELAAVTEQRDRLAEAIEAASVLIAAKGRHNTMLAYNGLRDALQSLTQNANLSDRHE